MKIAIEVLSGPLDGHIFTALPGNVIGRRADIEIACDRFISRQHAKVDYQESQLTIEDLNSTNGSFINNEAFTGKITIENNQVLKLGRTWVQLRICT